jgi:hypothetical protein
MPIDYMPVEGLDDDGNDPIPFNAAAISRMREAAVISRNKENAKLISKRPMLYAYLWEHLSSDSAVVVASHTDYEDAHRASDPTLLWNIIVYTHLTHVNGAGPELAELVRDDQQEKFASMKQTSRESIGDFLKRLKHAYTLLIVAGVPEYTEPQKAIHFLKRLDQHRHGMMYAEMINRAHRNEPLPQTLFAAYTIASNYLVKKTQSSFALEEHRIFMMNGGGRGGGRGQQDAGRGGGRGQQDAGRGGGRGRGGGANKKDASEKVETRSCYNCGELGHIRPKCPHPREESNNLVAVTTTVDDNSFDDAMSDTSDGYAYAFVTRAVPLLTNGPADGHSAVSSDPMVVLSTNRSLVAKSFSSSNLDKNTVILDSGANIHCFGSPNLLENIRVTPQSIRISGFEKNGGIILKNVGTFSKFGNVWFDNRLTVNILSFPALVANGAIIRYDNEKDCFYVKPPTCDYSFIFRRESKSGLYTTQFHNADPWRIYGGAKVSSGEKNGYVQYFQHKILMTTVLENQSKFTAREVAAAAEARHFMGQMGFSNSIAAKRVVNNMLNCKITERAIDIADIIYGPRSYQSLSGSTKKLKTTAAAEAIIPRLMQQQQVASIDLMFVKPHVFLIMLLKPLDMIFCQVLNSFTGESAGGPKSAVVLSKCLHIMISTCKSRGFIVQALKCDGEKAIGPLTPLLNNLGLEVFITGAGGHVPEIESRIRLIKEKAREFFTCLPFTMPNVMIVYCIYFSTGIINNYISIHSSDNCSPRQRFTGRKLDAKLDIRFSFGDYCHATVANTDNSMNSRTDPCICLLSSMNLNGSVKMLDLNSFKIITRDQFVILPMPQSVIQRINRVALDEGRKHTVRFAGGQDIIVDIEGANLPNFIVPADEDIIQQDIGAVQQPEPGPALAIEGGDAPIIVIDDPIEGGGPIVEGGGPIIADQDIIQAIEHVDVVPAVIQEPSEMQRSIRESFRRPPAASVLHLSVKAALRDDPDAARISIISELKQMLAMKVWTPVYKTELTPAQIKAIIRSNMICKKKFLPSGVFEKYKSRLVAGGHMQDKTLYPELRSETIGTSFVYLVASIAARERRIVVTIDITGAYLHAEMKYNIIVYMHINKILLEMIISLDKSYTRYICHDGGCIVRLDKALYGTVEGAALWGDDISGTLIDDGYNRNKYQACCYNKVFYDNIQITVAIHVDDLLVTCTSQTHIDSLVSLLTNKYGDIKVNTGLQLGYLGLVLDFSSAGSVLITAPGFVSELLLNCRETGSMVSPATEHLFEARDPSVAELVGLEDKTYFHSEVAKLLYIGKRVYPEILAAIAFLTTRINVVDTDDMSKLARVHGYIRNVKDRGIRLHIGTGEIVVRAHVDASYNVHVDGKSHTGCIVTVGDGGAIYFRSAKQKIVTKSSTEAELVAASDSAGVSLHIANFLRDQGYSVPPVLLYQDNKSAIALLGRGYSTSDLTKHISLRYFWIKERTSNGEIVIEFCPTAKMFANVLTKPLGGRQFLAERNAITGWM